MPAPELALVKSWCRIDGAEYDIILPVLIADATAQAGRYVAQDDAHYTTTAMPSSVEMWCCAQVAHWLENPSASVLPSGNNPQRNMYLDGLLDAYRQYGLESAP